ncbi:Hypothetical protein CAP_8950 [Chondromyces apiculatus DSM 436]|uniref:Uncharacterized protein n=1 Tax=Chondromyces apiculatus DSM 436 TaxID=1192034 RepID=A0A017SX01_9BACT|nr:Hypothetical protein CAP_8950 [Chondromyces apiculatus DSM 436]
MTCGRFAVALRVDTRSSGRIAGLVRTGIVIVAGLLGIARHRARAGLALPLHGPHGAGRAIRPGIAARRPLHACIQGALVAVIEVVGLAGLLDRRTGHASNHPAVARDLERRRAIRARRDGAHPVGPAGVERAGVSIVAVRRLRARLRRAGPGSAGRGETAASEPEEERQKRGNGRDGNEPGSTSMQTGSAAVRKGRDRHGAAFSWRG